ncbi:ubiquitin carboxyl-terminal hydrolase 25-like [Physella acuta]|uniref:ubiquitin carboxyl-terminal hydrolase 25-like n=1 Tax=Physella acuta TaxID=109671 RepID=UPI0027DE66E2|nr:ubiquitin carboxyl-terminal hydrolase 25-like [Physella acuta]
MTVEQSPIPLRAGQRTREESSLAKIKEVTGAPDNIIEEAIKACLRTDGTYKLEDVVTTIIGDDISLAKGKPPKNRTRQTNVKSEDQVDALPGHSSSPDAQKQVAMSTVSAKQATDEYIDLTRDPQGILGGQISREEQDISRVLEASIAESKGTTKRKRGELWFIDPLNPYERKRVDGWPVGLKNVGNTCWFSAVIQSLFHIRKFREIVLHYQQRPVTEGEVARNLRFVTELRHLFAFMVGSHRKYVDPSKAVDILKEASATTVLDGQQDVSEFQHKLLDWLEDAFSSPASQSVENPVHQLFQGKYKAEGFHEGKMFTQEVTFGQYPLNVVGFHDLHESLEATTAQGEIETISGDSSQKSGQEIWFTHLPVVLTFELSRFGFNQQLNRAEKIHQELSFPPVIYVDRYLECNKTVTRQKREEARKLKDELSSLQARLDKFVNYGSSNKRYPLPDVLKYALEFAESSPTQEPLLRPSTPQHPNDIEMESPILCSRASQSVTMSIDLTLTPTTQPLSELGGATVPCGSDRGIQSKTTSSTLSSSPVPEAKKFKDSSVQVEFDATLMPSSVVMPGTNVSFTASLPVVQPASSLFDPHPRSVTTEELKVLQDCLKRWREEVETDVRELQRNISVLEGKLDGMYSDEYMMKYPYHLHAVLVHEGQAVSGHYWSFIYDDGRGRWLKFNDITVSESSLEEMHKESVGGFHNASAYCLMYVDKSRLDTGQGDSINLIQTLPSLPTDLRQFVEEDNTLFRQELHLWDEEQKRKSSAAAAASVVLRNVDHDTQTRSGADDPDVVVTGEQRPGQSGETIRPVNSAVVRLADQHAQLSLGSTLTAVTNITCNNPQEVLPKAFDNELKRLKEASRLASNLLPMEDQRLSHIVLFLLCCQADIHTVEIILSEQFALCGMLQASNFKGVRQQAHEVYKKLCNSVGHEGIKHYEFWHRRYHHYRQAVFMFNKAIEAYCTERYQEALPYFNQACLHNCEPGLTKDLGSCGLDPKMLSYFRRISLQRVNNETLKSFECDEDMTDALTIMTNQILPTLIHLAASDMKDDITCVEDIREKWCRFLEKDLTGDKIERLQDLLSKMFEANGTMAQDLTMVRDSGLRENLQDGYSRAMRKLKERGDLNSWLDTS